MRFEGKEQNALFSQIEVAITPPLVLEKDCEGFVNICEVNSLIVVVRHFEEQPFEIGVSITQFPLLKIDVIAVYSGFCM